MAGGGRPGCRNAATCGAGTDCVAPGRTMPGVASDMHSGQNWQSGTGLWCAGGAVPSDGAEA